MNEPRPRAKAAIDPALYAYLQDHQPPEHEEQRKLRDVTSTMPRGRMQIAPEQGHFLAFLVRLIGARQTLEIGRVGRKIGARLGKHAFQTPCKTC